MTQSREASGLTFAVFVEDGTIGGFVFDANDLDRQFVVELLLDGWPCQLARANAYDQRSPAAGSSHGHGFAFSLPEDFVGHEALVRLANSEAPLGLPIDLTAVSPRTTPFAPGSVAWHGGLRFAGWIRALPDDAERRIRGLIDEEIVFDIASDGWTFVKRGGGARSMPAFDVHLPERFADGRVHRLAVTDDDGTPLLGSPVPFIAFADGLEVFMRSHAALDSERLRGRLFDRLIPQSMPFHWLAAWRERFPIGKPKDARTATGALVLFGHHDIDSTLKSLERSTSEVLVGALPLAADGLSFEAADLTAFLTGEGRNAELVVFAPAGTQLEPSAIAHFLEALTTHDTAPFAYADIVLETAAGAPVPLALPSFDPELFLEQGLGANLFALDRRTAMAAAHKGATTAFELLALAVDEGAPAEPRHISAFLGRCPRPPIETASEALGRSSVAALLRSGIRATARARPGEMLPAVNLSRLSAAESVAVLVRVQDRVDEARATLDALRSQRTRHRIDVHVVDIGSSEEATLRYMAGLRGQREHVFRSDELHNTARALNAAVVNARGRFLCFLDAGCVPEGPDYFEELVAHCVDNDVAAAGPVLTSTSGIVRAAGLVLGPGFTAVSAFVGATIADAGYADLLRVARSCSALPCQGLLVKRNEFLSYGGFDSNRFPTFFHSVDLCLGLRRGRRRVVVSPHCRLAIPDRSWLPMSLVDRQRPDLDGETVALRSKWGEALTDDPTYSAALNLDGKPYSALAWPPRTPSLHRTAAEADPDLRARELRI